jgi:hypothetical protein
MITEVKALQVNIGVGEYRPAVPLRLNWRAILSMTVTAGVIGAQVRFRRGSEDATAEFPILGAFWIPASVVLASPGEGEYPMPVEGVGPLFWRRQFIWPELTTAAGVGVTQTSAVQLIFSVSDL